MSEHLDTHGLEHFIARKLPPDELLRAARHIGVCQSCRERIERTGARIESLRVELRRGAQTVEPHLDYEQLAAYVDDTLDAVGREIAGNHLAVCSPCTREVQELEAIRAELMQPHHASSTAASLPSENLWQRFTDSFRLSPRIAWAAVALFIIITAAGLLLLRQRGSAPEVAGDNSNGNAPAVVNNSNVNVLVVNSNDSVNVNANAHVADATNRNNSVNATRRDTARPDTNVNQSVSGSPYEAVVRRALATHRLDRAPVLNELAGRPSTLMSGSQSIDLSRGPEGESFALLRPVGTVTLSNRPTFSWQPLAGATSYQVHVLDTDFNVVAESGPITAASWSSPLALKRGVVYLWQVSAVKDGKVISAPAAPAPEARFMILTTAKARAVQRARAGRRRLASGARYHLRAHGSARRRRTRISRGAQPDAGSGDGPEAVTEFERHATLTQWLCCDEARTSVPLPRLICVKLKACWRLTAGSFLPGNLLKYFSLASC